MTTKISSDNIQQATLDSIGGGPTISSVQVTDSSYTVLDDTAVNTTGGYIKITGSKFTSGVQVYVGSVLATSVTRVSSTTLHVQVPATASGTYELYVVNVDGSFGLRPNGITFSPNDVTWVTGSTLDTQYNGVPISIQLNATGATGYQLQAGSSLPSGLTLSTGGLLSGTVTVTDTTNYSFTVEAYDAELQDASRSFSLIISNATAATAIDYLVVGGGGGGGDRHGGGGGGGGYRAFANAAISAGTTYNITVGAGGALGTYEAGNGQGGRGGDSSFIGGAISTTALGGGGGGTYGGNPTGSFGSGGGGGGNNLAGIAGTAGQGNSGGSGSNPGGGGGGGAGAAGGNASVAGSGGVGLQWLDGNYYAGGGGGGWQASGGPATPGGNGGGGNGAWDDATITAGAPNTGGGGGGSRSNNSTSTGRPGGSGVVIIRYPDTFMAASSTTGSVTYTVTGGYRYYKFTGNGTIVF